MPQVSYPGVYIVELPSGVRTITGVPTSIAAFIGYTPRGRENQATLLFSWADFERNFGGLAIDSDLSYAVQSFFANGGGQAYVIRVPKGSAEAATLAISDSADANATAVSLTASSTGTWGNNLVADINYDPAPADPLAQTFNLTLTDLATGTSEAFAGLSADKTRPNYYKTRLNDPDSGSALVVAGDAEGKADGGKGRRRPRRTRQGDGKADGGDSKAYKPVRNGTVSNDIDSAAILKWDEKKKYTLVLSADDDTKTKIDIDVVEVGEKNPPDTLVGLAHQIEQRGNAKLRTIPSSLAIGCVVVNGTAAKQQALKIVGTFDRATHPGLVDTVVTVEPKNEPIISKDLKWTASVSRFYFGSKHQAGKGGLAKAGAAGQDGTKLPGNESLIGDQAKFTGLYALDKVSFNLLSIPEATRASTGDPNVLDTGLDPNLIFSAAMTYCVNRRAFLLIDPPPEVSTVEKATVWRTTKLTVTGLNGATYFPRLRIPDPLDNFRLRTVAPSGVVAGLYARTDANRGVWKAPAGIDASLTGVAAPVYVLSDGEQGVLNPIGLNCFRALPVYGNVSFGARTLVGGDAQASDWKYVPVRRTALFIEESLYRGTQWIIFEANDESLWAQIRLNVGAFMHSLFVQGAFRGKSPHEAYLVKCDSETTTQNDINNGIVNVLVGFAPMRPAEFVILQIKQLAGQIQT
jgi:phage tail sheath protein FI